MARKGMTRDSAALTLMMHALMSLAVVFLAAGIGSMAVPPNMGWYHGLVTPDFTPPDRTFSTVWTILYLMMAAALLLVWQSKGSEADRRLAFRWFGVQLVLNVAWSWAFFGLHSPLLSLLVLFALLIAVAGTIVVFDRVSRWASVLMMPYLLWSCFATALNAAIWFLNG